MQFLYNMHSIISHWFLIIIGISSVLAIKKENTFINTGVNTEAESDMVRHELRVTSCKLKSTSW